MRTQVKHRRYMLSARSGLAVPHQAAAGPDPSQLLPTLQTSLLLGWLPLHSRKCASPSCFTPLPGMLSAAGPLQPFEPQLRCLSRRGPPQSCGS